MMSRFASYHAAETWLVDKVVKSPDFITKTTFEKIGIGFVLLNPKDVSNGRSNYEYAEKFFEWMMSGEIVLSKELLQINPWVKRFVDSSGLPENFSTSYGWKIKNQLGQRIKELSRDRESRKAYVSILIPEDYRVVAFGSTQEYPCTIGIQLFIREERLHMMVNMRSNNIWAVLPYDVYNFTCLQDYVAKQLGITMGYYHHQINSAHIFKGDVRRYKESLLKQT